MSDDFNPTLSAISEIPAEPSIENEDPNEAARNALAARLGPKKTPAGRKREALAAEKLDCLRHLRQSVDTLIYTELFILYYMDCSFFRLLIRALAQLVLFSPIGTRSPVARPYVSGIFIPNIVCILLHIFSARPEAGETMRGYLHGGVIMDLIGQKGPTSKIHLLLLDLLVLAMQCFIVAVNTECRVLDSYVRNKEYRVPEIPLDNEMRNQDHDAEERGVFRVAGTTSDDIELQDLSRRENSDEDSNEEGEQHSLLGDHLLRDPQPRVDELEEWLDLHYAGIAVTAEFHIWNTLRNQYRIYKTRAQMVQDALTTGSVDRTSGFSAMSDIFARAMDTDTSNNDRRG